MKKRFLNKNYHILFFVLLMCLCSKKAAYSESFQKKISGKKICNIGTGRLNGVYYSLGLAIASLYNSRNTDFLIVAEPTKGAVENLELLRSGELSLAFIQSDVAYNAYFGKGKFVGKAFPDLRVLASLYSETVHLVVPADSPISSPIELKGKRISTGEDGSGTTENAKTILNHLGIRENDYQSFDLNLSAALNSLKSGSLDAVFFTGGAPVHGFSMFSNENSIRLLSLSDNIISKIISEKPYLASETIEAGLYGEKHQKVQTVGLKALLVTTKSFESAACENILKLVFSNQAYLVSSCRAFRPVTLEEMLEGIDQTMLHEGAVSFFH
ncbi:MAG: TAXI family TRAP transporter solute-binding subunit [Candidatus Riflebacteria bacterium]|nr:TAXI family TRAP transporter solute-binding subunit [Candidatus Riflebacteria bacterium]